MRHAHQIFHDMMGNRKLVSNEKGLAQNVSEVASDKASRSATTRSNSPPAKERCPKGGVVDSYSGIQVNEQKKQSRPPSQRKP